jgi:hypothetical protein
MDRSVGHLPDFSKGLARRMVGAVRLEYWSEARCYVGELFAVHSDAVIRTVIERIETKGERLGDMIARRSTAPRTTGSAAACAATSVFSAFSLNSSVSCWLTQYSMFPWHPHGHDPETEPWPLEKDRRITSGSEDPFGVSPECFAAEQLAFVQSGNIQKE